MFTAGLVPDPGQLEAVDVNLWIVTDADKRVNFLTSPTEVYLLQEQDDQNLNGTSAGPWMGVHPTIRFKENQWHEKHGPAHEYGHLVAFDIPNAQAGHATEFESAVRNGVRFSTMVATVT